VQPREGRDFKKNARARNKQAAAARAVQKPSTSGVQATQNRVSSPQIPGARVSRRAADRLRTG
jgi:hypothetical protein